MRPIECPRNRMALSAQGPTRSMEYVRGCRVLTGIKAASCLTAHPETVQTDRFDVSRNPQVVPRGPQLGANGPKAPSGGLLNRLQLRDRRGLLPPLCFRLALLAGCALARGDFVEGASLRLQPVAPKGSPHSLEFADGQADHGPRPASARRAAYTFRMLPAIASAILAPWERPFSMKISSVCMPATSTPARCIPERALSSVTRSV